MIKAPGPIGLNDPLSLRKTEGQLTQASIIANGKQNISNSEITKPYTTVQANNVSVTTTTSNVVNTAGDTTTIYTTPGNVYVSAIDQNIRNITNYNGSSGYSGFSGFSGAAGTLLPNQTGQGGNYLYTDGTDPTWVPVTQAAAFKPQVFQFTYEDIFTDGSPTSPVTADELYISPTTYVEIDSPSTSLIFFDPGTYSVNIQGQLLDQADDSLWYTFKTSYGPKLITDTSMGVVNLQDYFEHFTSTDIRDNPFVINGPSFNDTFIVQTAPNQLLDIQLWVYSFYAEGEQAIGKTVVTITRLSDDAGPWGP